MYLGNLEIQKFSIMGGGESKNSQLLKYGGLLSEAERETLRTVFSNIAGDSEASTISLQQFKVNIKTSNFRLCIITADLVD